MEVVMLGSVPIPAYECLLVCLAMLMMFLLVLVLHFTAIGLRVRAILENREIAEGFGIPANKVYFWSFVVGAALAGFSGALLAPLSSVTPLMGFDYSLRAFMVVIAGGLTHWTGPLFGSLLVAGSSSVLNTVFGVTGATLGSLVITLLVVLIRPSFQNAIKE
jgi:branched-chain amino acid transport system permease protein/urea transport system permease protein